MKKKITDKELKKLFLESAMKKLAYDKEITPLEAKALNLYVKKLKKANKENYYISLAEKIKAIFRKFWRYIFKK